MKAATVKPNLRNQQRVDVESDIVIEKPDGCQLTCKISNLSRTGVMVFCNQEAAGQLIPRLRAPTPGNWIDVKARFSVPVVATQPVSILAKGHIVHLRRMARDEFQLGIQFADFEGNGFDYVDRYVRKLLADTLKPA
ncbi:MULTISPECIES: PilZ domain-containing protein [Marinobacter]|uniref:PilZ domain-containing protein n=1 Tax=Marinobacter xiaoshiensis TaxID=3073652 RepID=A0ABU2HE73_9GAMM|nr:MULTISPECIES: PilZ domain-containing protein [unclassified Marinobacter]MBK1873423.1 PilZ domain-containing protein [Marinobacter sp. 1-3A]MBK1885358.1 PilZ domain-containing protein [Marinobacter sp. DY40_1A1]MDS1309379.1 PilZ domain-containing protein [Marinobacter sp. F60267]